MFLLTIIFSPAKEKKNNATNNDSRLFGPTCTIRSSIMDMCRKHDHLQITPDKIIDWTFASPLVLQGREGVWVKLQSIENPIEIPKL